MREVDLIPMEQTKLANLIMRVWHLQHPRVSCGLVSRSRVGQGVRLSSNVYFTLNFMRTYMLVSLLLSCPCPTPPPLCLCLL